MPIYEYICEACDETLDALQKMSDAPLTDCPKCGASRLRKKISAPGFRLSGSGWYETDFKSGNKRNVADKADAQPSSKPSSKPSADSSGHSCGSGGCGSCG